MYKGAKLLKRYKNGNYTVRLYEDGTKERFTVEDSFVPDFPESIDLKITNRCDLLCPMCHEQSTPDGIHGDLSEAFLSSLPEGMELAIGGGNPLSHPRLKEFLLDQKKRGVIANLTINEAHLLMHVPLVSSLLDEGLIHGLGISLSRYDEKTFEFASAYPNCVFHLILGLVDVARLKEFPVGYKALFLGYKRFGRGEKYFSEEIANRIKEFEKHFLEFKKRFSVMAFDNLALEQIHMKRHLPKPLYDRYYMGNDGEMTMYVDLVKREFAVSSTSKERFPLKNTLKEMFDEIRR